MTSKDRAEHNRLARKWATGCATAPEIERCRALDRKDQHERRKLLHEAGQPLPPNDGHDARALTAERSLADALAEALRIVCDRDGLDAGTALSRYAAARGAK